MLYPEKQFQLIWGTNFRHGVFFLKKINNPPLLAFDQSGIPIKEIYVKKLFSKHYVAWFPKTVCLGSLSEYGNWKLLLTLSSKVGRLFFLLSVFAVRLKIRSFLSIIRKTMLAQWDDIDFEISHFCKTRETDINYKIYHNNSNSYTLQASRTDGVKAYFLEKLAIPKDKFIHFSSPVLAEGFSSTLPSTRTCYFSHFDYTGRVHNYVKYYLKCLKDAGFGIVFVSTCLKLDPADKNDLFGICEHIVHKKNLGYDFGSWLIGLIERPPLPNQEEILFANDSVFGPIRPLDQVFAKARQNGFDLFGITDNFDFHYHLQSYFLWCSKKLISSDVFSSFWRDFEFIANKVQIIKRYELGISKRINDAGFTIGAALEYNDVVTKALKLDKSGQVKSFLKELPHRNPTHFFWNVLIRDMGCPFIKRELLQLNPCKLDINGWEEILHDIGAERQKEMILDYLDNNPKVGQKNAKRF